MKVLVHSFNMGDVEEPALYAASPIYEWQQTEAGKWVMEHSKPEPIWNMGINYKTYGYTVYITAELDGPDVTYFNLKWGNK
jgi:hypothetical protein